MKCLNLPTQIAFNLLKNNLSIEYCVFCNDMLIVHKEEVGTDCSCINCWREINDNRN